MTMRYPACWIIGLLFMSGNLTAEDKSLQASIILTAQQNGTENQKEFSCYGKIHGYIRLSKRESGAHHLESRWISPTGHVEADSQTLLDFKPAASTAYVWFGFPESSGIGGLSDPQLEQDRLTYNGLWHVEVRWDQNSVIKQEFRVRCP